MVYSPRIFFRPDLFVFRCTVRPFEGRSTWRASSYMWYVSRGDCVEAKSANAFRDAGPAGKMEKAGELVCGDQCYRKGCE